MYLGCAYIESSVRYLLFGCADVVGRAAGGSGLTAATGTARLAVDAPFATRLLCTRIFRRAISLGIVIG